MRADKTVITASRLREHTQKKEMITILKEKTFVSMVFRKIYICFHTVSRSRKSPHWFYISRDSLKELEYKSKVIVYDIRSFAVLRVDAHTGTIEIEITWLSGDEDHLSGYQDMLALPYEKMKECLRESQQGEPVVWKTLSMGTHREQPHPRFVFNSRKNLHAVLENKIIRCKLIRFLRDQFQWPCSERIEFYDDFVPYSFTFKEIRENKPVMTGGLILHGQEDLKSAHYSIHT